MKHLLGLPFRAAGVAAVDVGHGLDHFAEGAVGEGAFDEGGHDILVVSCGFSDGFEGGVCFGLVAFGFELFEGLDLDGFDFFGDGEDVDLAVFVVVDIFVDADDDAVSGFAFF